MYNTFLFNESTYFTFNPLALTLLTCTEVHVDKIILNPGSGTWEKGRDQLPEWSINCISNFEEMQNNTCSDLIQN